MTWWESIKNYWKTWWSWPAITMRSGTPWDEKAEWMWSSDVESSADEWEDSATQQNAMDHRLRYEAQIADILNKIQVAYIRSIDLGNRNVSLAVKLPNDVPGAMVKSRVDGYIANFKKSSTRFGNYEHFGDDDYMGLNCLYVEFTW